jgi:hypothetical protein
MLEFPCKNSSGRPEEKNKEIERKGVFVSVL